MFNCFWVAVAMIYFMLIWLLTQLYYFLGEGIKKQLSARLIMNVKQLFTA